MADDREPERPEGGRVVYSRLSGEGADAAPAGGDNGGGGSAGARGRRKFEPFLPVLVGSFVLLIGLVVGLGWLSEEKLRAVIETVQRQELSQAGKTEFLLSLRNALINLNTEALTRQERLARRAEGDIVNPFNVSVGQKRSEVTKLLPTLDRLAFAQTPRGREFRQRLDEYMQTTADVRVYQLDGFPRFRDLDAQLGQLLAEAAQEHQALVRRRGSLDEQTAQGIRRLTFLAAALAVVIAAFSAWELQRRFRQLRASLDATRREREFNTQMFEGLVSAVAALDGRARIRSANRSFFRLFPQAGVGATVQPDATDAARARLLSTATATRIERVTYHGRWPLDTGPPAATAGTTATTATAASSATKTAPAATPAAGGAAGAAAPRAFDVYSAPLTIDGEHGQILTLVDVTEAARAERELRRKTALAAVGQAAAQVAHEIKNPLGSIRLGVAMLRDMTPSREAHETIDLVERGIEHLNKLTMDVTQFSRERELTLTATNLDQLLDSSLELVADRLGEKQTPVEQHYVSPAPVGQWDADQLRQVFVNLLANAVDASAAAQPVAITTATATLPRPSNGGAHEATGAGQLPAVRVTITDRGSGLDEHTRARLFEPFFTTKKRGTGLGLAIVKKIVEQHGGRITVDSTPGQGTSFHVELPLSPGS